MKIKELENLNYASAYLTIGGSILEDKTFDSKIKLKDFGHFLSLMSSLKEGTSVTLEDGDKKYIISGDFATRV